VRQVDQHLFRFAFRPGKTLAPTREVTRQHFQRDDDGGDEQE
jgi:hypothetical protein